MVTEVAFLLLLQTACGSVFMLRIMSTQPFGPKFFKVNGLIVLGLALLACVSVPRSGPYGNGGTAVAAASAPALFGPSALLLFSAAFALLWAAYLATLFVRPSLSNSALRIAMLAGFVAVAEAAFAYSGPFPSAAARIALVAGALLSSVLLGAGLIGMLVGHWYLNDSRLPFEPLEICATSYLVLTGAQAVAVLFSISLAGQGAALSHALAMEQLSDLFIWIRVLPGLLAPVALAAMIRHTVKLRANMSATGLLYVSMILTACGEAFSRYLLVAQGLLA